MSNSEALKVPAQAPTTTENSVKRKRSPMSKRTAPPSGEITLIDQGCLEKQPLISEIEIETDSINGKDGDNDDQKTYLYLGFGSNLAKSAFEGRRGIRPLAQVNVHAPSLEVTFDLPGIAYKEPCFANSRRRVPAESNSSKVVVAQDDNNDSNNDDPSSKKLHATEYGGWTKGLVGTVYEVTAADFKQIIQTEGAGASYEDVEVECWTVPRGSAKVPEPESYPTPSRPLLPQIPHDWDDDKPHAFLARTLLAPLPAASSHMFRKPGWAQPSERYIGLLRTGARERALPAEYVAWLDAVTPFTATTLRQKAGGLVFMTAWFPFFMVLMTVAKLVTDEHGRAPAWYGWLMIGMMERMWWSYDLFTKPLFGDGERTIGT